MSLLAAYGVDCRRAFNDLLQRLEASAREVSIFLVYDRPERATLHPELERTYFVQRCLSDQQLDGVMSSLREVGCYVQLFTSEREFAVALTSNKIQIPGRPLRLVYNGIEGSIGRGAFGPGRKALLPALCDSFRVPCANSSAYACAVGRHKFHYSQILRANGLPIPPMWFFEPEHGWMLDSRPPKHLRVIVKSTYESWSIGVTQASVFHVAEDLDERVSAIAETIGQSVCVQQFVAGDEVCVPILGFPEMYVPQLVGTRIARQPDDPDAVMTIDDNLAEGGVQHFAYAGSNAAEQTQAAEIAAQCCRVLALSGLARVDMRLTANGGVHVFDIGVSPGITVKGSSAAGFRALGYSYEQFVRLVFAASLARSGLI